MAGEIRKEEEMFENESAQKSVVNPELKLIMKELSKFYSEKSLNEINLYLYALVLKE